jgi:hypothetical protein
MVVRLSSRTSMALLEEEVEYDVSVTPYLYPYILSRA